MAWGYPRCGTRFHARAYVVYQLSGKYFADIPKLLKLIKTRETVKNFGGLKQIEWIENMMADETKCWQISLAHFKGNH